MQRLTSPTASEAFHLAAVMCHLPWRHMCFFLIQRAFPATCGPPLHPPESRLTKMSCCEDLTLWKLAAAVINTRKQHWSWGCGGGAAAVTLYVGPRAVCAKGLNLGSLTDADFSPLHWGPSLYIYIYHHVFHDWMAGVYPILRCTTENVPPNPRVFFEWTQCGWRKKLRNAALSSTQMLREFFLMCSKRHDLRARSRYFTEHNAGLCSRKDDFYYEDANWLPYSSGGSSTSGPQEGKIQIVLLLKAKFCWLKSRVPVKRRWFNRNLARTSRC